MVAVFIVSPLPAVRAGLRAFIGAAEDCEVIGEAERLGATDERLSQAPPDVVVLDAGPDLEMAPTGVLDGQAPGPGLVILGSAPADHRLGSALRGRVWGYLPRDASGDQLLAAVRAVANGLFAIDARLGSDLFAEAGWTTEDAPDEVREELTSREREVLQLVTLGLPNKTIAHRLGISEHTVKFHVAAILGKLSAGSRTEAVHLAARRGLIVL